MEKLKQENWRSQRVRLPEAPGSQRSFLPLFIKLTQVLQSAFIARCRPCQATSVVLLYTHLLIRQTGTTAVL